MTALPSSRQLWNHWLATVLVRHALIVLVFLLAWDAAAIFEVRPYVSALYFASGVTFSVAVLLGWKYLPGVYFAAVLAYYTSFSALPLPEVYWIASLRQTLIYGLAGLSIRHLWLSERFRLTLPIAFRFLLTALAASLVSATAAIHMDPFRALPQETKVDVFFSFWGGDFAGVMVTVPILLILSHALKHLRHSRHAVWQVVLADQSRLRDAALLSAFGVTMTLLVILLPPLLSSDARIEILALLPVLVAGLTRGAIVAFVVAMLVTLLEVFVRPWLGIPVGMPIDVQLLIAMNAAVALLAGAAHDDKAYAWDQANHDALTGLINHRCFLDRLNQEVLRSRRTQQPFALMYVDLDGFKDINDRYGHAAGDQVLRTAAVRLRGHVRSSDTVARLGGDEFAIILSDARRRADVECLAQALLNQLEQPMVLENHSVRVTASMGVVVADPGSAEPTTLMHQADMAMYQSKSLGKNRYAAVP
jgi:diguanylate cyclase (GGDEF)-like protein